MGTKGYNAVVTALGNVTFDRWGIRSSVCAVLWCLRNQAPDEVTHAAAAQVQAARHWSLRSFDELAGVERDQAALAAFAALAAYDAALGYDDAAALASGDAAAMAARASDRTLAALVDTWEAGRRMDGDPPMGPGVSDALATLDKVKADRLVLIDQLSG